ncbi:ATP-binding protein [Streptomyces rameus]|uniref:ATP-binding protein n=1 Tax=Streptomyces rameus TaxID=68261 RepID=UPI003CD0C3AB
MSEIDRERAFDRFWRASDSHHDGTGLGLPIVRHLVDASGGTITRHRAPGTGHRPGRRRAAAPGDRPVVVRRSGTSISLVRRSGAANQVGVPVPAGTPGPLKCIGEADAEQGAGDGRGWVRGAGDQGGVAQGDDREAAASQLGGEAVGGDGLVGELA